MDPNLSCIFSFYCLMTTFFIVTPGSNVVISSQEWRKNYVIYPTTRSNFNFPKRSQPVSETI